MGKSESLPSRAKTKSLDADGQKAVEVIERQTSRLLGLVEDLRRINPRE